MTEERIPLATIDSGEKFVNKRGMRVIKDGIKASSIEAAPLPKPDWLRMRMQSSPKFDAVRSIVHEHRLATVCEEAKCPNISECWSAGTATIMLMGDVCTRACRFCASCSAKPSLLPSSTVKVTIRWTTSMTALLNCSLSLCTSRANTHRPIIFRAV